MFVTLDDTRKNVPKTFVIVETAFLELFVFIALLGPKEMFLSIAKSLSKHLLDLYIVFFVIFMFDETRKKRPETFHHWKDCLFFKTLCFQQSSSSLKKALISSSVIVRTACGPL